MNRFTEVSHTDATYKTTCHLKDGYKSMKQKAVQDITIRPHDNKLKGLHESLANVLSIYLFIEKFAEPLERICSLRPPHGQVVIVYF